MPQIQAPLTDNSLMPFGKFKGKALINVPAHYLLWLYDKGCSNPELMAYIIENLNALRKEAGKL